MTVSPIVYATAGISENIIEGRLTSLPHNASLLLAFGLMTGGCAIVGVVTHSPRTRLGDITVGTDEGIPALLLRQSRLTFILTMAVLALSSVFLVVWLWPRSDPEFDSLPLAIRVATWALAFVVTCGWQVGIAVLVLLCRIRPGYIAIRQDGIRIRGYANDAWIPWESASPVAPREDWKYLNVWLRHDNHATVSSLVPWPWRNLDNRAFGYVRSSRPHDRALSVYTDRRVYRIAPEIIDAAVFHYIKNPGAREELRGPATIARTVDTLRVHATTAWWRSQTRPVPIPNLTIGSR